MSSTKKRITGRQIAAARELLNLTQRDLAAAIGMLQPMLARIEAAKVTPRIATLERIAAELERRGVEFLNGRGVILKQPEPGSQAEAESVGE